MTTIENYVIVNDVVKGVFHMVLVKPRIENGSVYSRQEAAETLGVSLSTLKRLIRKGHLKVSKPDGMRRVFITGESIQSMLENTVVERGA